MSMEIGLSANIGQLTATRAPNPNEPTNKARENFERFTGTSAKTEESDQQQLSLAEYTGKGQNIDVMA